MRKTLLGGLLVATIALTGCTAQAGADADAAATSSDRPQTEFERYMAVLYGDDPDTDYQALSREYENIVAACMAAEGFEYIPVDYSQGDAPEAAPAMDATSKEWAAEYGYGFIKYDFEETGQEDEFVDPNTAYLDGLSEVEREAYNLALGGPPPSDDEDYEYDWKTAGCYGQADHEVYGQNPSQDEANAALVEALERHWEEADQDPGFTTLDTEWVACMTDAGYAGFSKQSDASDSIWVQVADREEPLTEAESAALLEEETTLAVADITCQEEIDFEKRMMAIYLEREQAFVDANRVELDAMVARAEQGE